MTTTNTTAAPADLAAELVNQRQGSDREFLLGAIGSVKNKRRFARVGWPGLPSSQVPLNVAATLRDLIAEGVVEQVDIEKNSKVTPGERQRYTYFAIAATEAAAAAVAALD